MKATASYRFSAALQRFLSEVPRLRGGAVVRVEVDDAAGPERAQTLITVSWPGKRPRRWRFRGLPLDIADGDLAPIRRRLSGAPWWGGWFRQAAQFVGWWMGFTGFIAAGSPCPCCGQPSCVVGMGMASALGALAALTFTKLKTLGRHAGRLSARTCHVVRSRSPWRLIAVVFAAALGVIAFCYLSFFSEGSASLGSAALDVSPRATAASSITSHDAKMATDQIARKQGTESEPLRLSFDAFREVRIRENDDSANVWLPAAIDAAIGKRVELSGIGFYCLAGMHGEHVCGFVLLPPYAVSAGEVSAPNVQRQWAVLVKCSTASWVRLPDYPRPVRACVEGYLAFDEPNPGDYLFTVHATKVEVRPLDPGGLKADEGGPPCPRCGGRHPINPSSPPSCRGECRCP